MQPLPPVSASERRISGTTKPYWCANFRRIFAMREPISSRDGRSAALSSLLSTSSISNDLSCSLIEARASALARSSLAAAFAAGGAVPFDASGNGDADEGHKPTDEGEGQERQARNDAEHCHGQRGEKERVGIAAQLVEDRFIGRAARAALGDQQAGCERNDERWNLRNQAVADRELGEDVGCGGERQPVAGDADDDAAEDVDGENDEARDRVAADEFRRAVHRAEEGAFLLEFPPARLRHLFV